MQVYLFLFMFCLVANASTATAAVPTNYKCLRNFYVSNLNGNDKYDGLTPQTAWKTLQRPDGDVRPGDCVNVSDGVYASEFGVAALSRRKHE